MSFYPRTPRQIPHSQHLLRRLRSGGDPRRFNESMKRLEADGRGMENFFMIISGALALATLIGLIAMCFSLPWRPPTPAATSSRKAS